MNIDQDVNAGIGVSANTDVGTHTDADDAPDPKPAVYTRFPRSFGFEYIAFVFMCPPLVVLWFFVASYYYLSGAISMPILKAAIYYSAAFAFALLLYGNDRATRKTRGVAIDGGRIIKKGLFGITELQCDEATGVRCTKNPLFKRRMVLKSASGSLSLPLNVRNGYKMVAAIFDKLAVNGVFRETSETEAVKRRLCGLAVRYGALYRLRGKYMRNFITAVSVAAVLNITTAMLYWERGLLLALAWGLGGMMFQTLAYLIAEKIWARKLHASMDSANRTDTDENAADPTEETASGMDDSFNAIHVAAALTALLIGMAAGIAVTYPA